MPNDYFTLEYIVEEIRLNCLGCKVNSIYSSNEKTIVFLLNNGQKSISIIFSFSNLLPILFLSQQNSFEKDPNPNGFIMSLRKHLYGAKLFNISMCDSDRIIKLEFLQKNELFDEEVFSLFFEIIGKKDNLIITDAKLIILNALKLNNSSDRLIMPSLKYELPSINLKNSSSPMWKLGKSSREEYLSLLLKTNSIENIFSIFNYDFLSPCVLLQNNKVVDFFAFPYKSIQLTDEMSWKHYSSLGECIELFYRDNMLIRQNNSLFAIILKHVNHILLSYTNRLEQLNKISSQIQELNTLYRQADILKCNLFRIQPNCSTISCDDYFNEGSYVDIPIDPNLSASENLNLKYKKYTKMKNSIEYSKTEIPKVQSNIDHLLSLIAHLSISTQNSDLECIINELTKSYGLIPGLKVNRNNLSVVKIAKENFIKLTIDSFIILIGKNNYQNDEITFHHSNPNDIWLHAQKFHGSHVLIKSNNSSVPMDIIEKAASFAGYYSNGRMETKINVDYTNIKYIRRGDKPGLVKYSNFKTLTVVPICPSSTISP